MDIIPLSVLNCLITIGNPDPSNNINILNPKYYNEVADIKIEDSFQKLINTATVAFHRQINIESSILNNEGERNKTILGKQDSLFQKGQRIDIQLCYGDNSNLKYLFRGFISSIIASNPFVLECEDFGYKLKRNSIPPLATDKDGTYINKFAEQLLKGTGLELCPDTKKMNIKIGQVSFEKNMTAADVLNSWKKSGLIGFIKMYNGKPYLSIGRSFLSVNTDERVFTTEANTPYVIRFDEHVADDKLKIHMLDSMFLALDATVEYPDRSVFKVTIRRDPDDPSKFQEINETKFTKNQKEKKWVTKEDISANNTNVVKYKDKIDLKSYNVRTFHEYNITRAELIKNAQAAFSQISETGIDGELVLFGDFGLQSGCKVELIDKYNPEKNGVYVVTEVTTRFGSSGYRQAIKIPYKLYTNKS